MADTTPPIAHNQVMAELRAIIEAKTASPADASAFNYCGVTNLVVTDKNMFTQ